ncbi:MAG: hypothetical protein ACUVRO_08125 [Armatimonadota bacterium]
MHLATGRRRFGRELQEMVAFAEHSVSCVNETLSQNNNGTGRLVQRAFAAVALALAAVHALAARHEVAYDGISYLDLADAWLSGDLHRVVNGYWSPLYPLLLVPAALVGRHWPYWEATAAHIVNLAIYAAAVAAFAFLVRQARASLETDPDQQVLPSALWMTLAWSLFLWTSLEWTQVRRLVPDLLVSAVVYGSVGLVLRIRDRGAGLGDAAALGLLLGLGYLAKAVMLGVGAALAVAAVLSSGKRSVCTGLACGVVFASLSVPWIAALSCSKGRFTIGDTGKLNYAWYVNGVTLHVHWQGEPSGYGKPTHPTRHILRRPDVYEFAQPVAGTYPPWFDPSYWYEGVAPRLNLGKQLRRSAHNCVSLLLVAVPALFVGAYALATRRCLWRLDVRQVRRDWVMWAPGLLAILVYVGILVLRRYVAPFAMLLWLVLLSGLRQARAHEAGRWSRGAVLTAVVPVLLHVGGLSAFWGVSAAVRAARGSVHPQWEVAQALQALGVQQGDPVASLGCAGKAYWARVAGVRVVAEAYDTRVRSEEDTFRAAGRPEELIDEDGALKERVLGAFRKVGVRAVVTRGLPPHAVRRGWHRLGRTDYCAYLLDR